MLTEQMTGAVGIVVAAQLIGGIGVYVWMSLALMAVFRKAGVAPWKAWVPVLNSWTLFELAGMRGWWAAVIAGGAIVVGGGALAVGGALGAAALGASFGGDTRGAQATLLAATLIPVLIWLIVLIPALILHVRMLLGVGRGFGLGVGHTVLGVLLFPVWASVVGWGAARWLGAGAVAQVSPAVEQGHGVHSGGPAAAPIVPPLADFSGRPGPAPAFGHLPVFGSGPAAATSAASGNGNGNGNAASPPAPAFGASPAFGAPPAFGAAPPFGAPARPAANPWAPPAAAAPPVVTPAASPSRPAAASAPAPAADGIEERTVLAGRRLPGWSLVLPGGGVVVLTADAAVLGRNPVAPARAPQAQVVAIDDVTRTVSKTHALLTRSQEGWILTDLDSTNGVFVGASPDAGTEVVGSAAVAGPFFLGDAALTLRADG